MMIRSLLVILLAAANIYGGTNQFDEVRTFLKPLLDRKWTGQYQDPPGRDVVHEVSWELVQQGHAIRFTREVPAGDFSKESLYYWDAESDRIVFITISSTGNLAKGTVVVEDDMLILEGISYRGNESPTFRQTFQMLEDGTLEDMYYTLVHGKAYQGHRIWYRAG